MSDLMHDWILLWCCTLLVHWGHIKERPTPRGFLTMLAFTFGVYYWLETCSAVSEIVYDVFFYFCTNGVRA